MPTLTDDQWGIKKEVTYGTPVTVDRFYPWLEVKGAWDVRRRQAQGLAGGGGRRTVLGDRSFLPLGRGEITTKVELESKAGGVLFDLAFGVSTVTAISGGSQQVFHPGLTGTLLPSATLQCVKVQNNGTNWVETYAGCTVSKVTIEQPEDDIATIEIEWDARSISTVTGAATAVYPTAPTVFDHSQAAAGLGGAFTAPTNTALGIVATAFADFREFSFELEQNIDIDRWVLGGRTQPIAGIPTLSFEGKAELNAATVPTAIIAGTRLPFQCTWTTTEVLGAGFTQLQLALPQLAITGDLPDVTPGETRVFDLKADVTNDRVNRDCYLVYRTTDTVL
jgi:hypothetical protein